MGVRIRSRRGSRSLLAEKRVGRLHGSARRRRGVLRQSERPDRKEGDERQHEAMERAHPCVPRCARSGTACARSGRRDRRDDDARVKRSVVGRIAHDRERREQRLSRHRVGRTPRRLVHDEPAFTQRLVHRDAHVARRRALVRSSRRSRTTWACRGAGDLPSLNFSRPIANGIG